MERICLFSLSISPLNGNIYSRTETLMCNFWTNGIVYELEWIHVFFSERKINKIHEETKTEHKSAPKSFCTLSHTHSHHSCHSHMLRHVIFCTANTNNNNLLFTAGLYTHTQKRMEKWTKSHTTRLSHYTHYTPVQWNAIQKCTVRFALRVSVQFFDVKYLSLWIEWCVRVCVYKKKYYVFSVVHLGAFA